jgi:thymidylate kinase
LNFQKAVRNVYLEIARKEKNWVVIKCAERVGDGWNIRNPEDIHREILQHVKKIISKN